MTKTAKATSISIPFELEAVCKKFCQDYHLNFSDFTRKAILSYLSLTEEEWFEGFKLYGRLREIDEYIVIARHCRDAMIYDGIGLEEIRDRRVEGKDQYRFKGRYNKQSIGDNKLSKGQIKDPTIRRIYDDYSKIIWDHNQERIKIMENPIFKNWLTSTLHTPKNYANEQSLLEP
jgi:hypothetical protein